MEPTIQERAAALGMIEKMTEIQRGALDSGKISVLDATIHEINQILFPGTKMEEVYAFDAQRDGETEFKHAFVTWKACVENALVKVSHMKNKVEADFEFLMCYLEHAGFEEIEQLLKDNLEAQKAKDTQVYELLIKIYQRYQGFWGTLDPERGVYDCVIQRARALKEHVEEWRWLFGELCDTRSKKALYNVLVNWITFEPSFLQSSKEMIYKDYFDFDLISETTEDEVFVDLGGYIGDTVEEFVNAYSANYKRIYTYEINPHNLKCLRETVDGYSDVVIRENAVGEQAGTLYLDMRIGGSSTTLAQNGEQAVAVVSLDEDITEKITWIKMDIEGSEQSALKGCKRHIEMEKPKLTICTYHNNEDIWKIPKMVKEYNPEYKLYFRYNGRSIHPSEYVLFAL